MGFGDKIHGAKWRENHRADTLRRIYKAPCIGGLVTPELPEPDLEPAGQAEWRLIRSTFSRITADGAVANACVPEINIPQQVAAPAIESIKPVIVAS